MSLRFNALLQAEGLQLAEVRLLRHQTQKGGGRTPYTLWRDDPEAFERYQAIQNRSARARFAGRIWASFVAPPSGGTLFVGLYDVEGHDALPPGTIDPLSGATLVDAVESQGRDFYVCRRADILSGYIGRLFVDWGESSRAWVQRASNQDKEIVELTRTFREEAFPGFGSLVRPLSEIETMPSSWQAVLRANRGVYLLACPRTREHYVGAAYGDDGFLGRWRDYAATGHGGNVALRGRTVSDYVVSILEVAGSAASVADIIAMEGVWKRKLLSRDMGLNLNG